MKATRNDMGGGNTIDLSWIRSLRADPNEACESLSDAPTRQAVQRDLGTGALEWGVAVAHRTTAYMIEELPVYGGDPAGEWLLGRAVESTVLASLRALVLDDIDLLWPAEEPAAATVSYVRRGIPMRDVLRAIHLCQEVLAQSLMDALRAKDGSLDDAVYVNEHLFRAFDRFSVSVVALYAEEHEKWSRHSDAARAELIQRVLTQPRINVKELSRALAYDLDGTHVAVVAWIDASHDVDSWNYELDLVVQRLRNGLPSAQILVRKQLGAVQIWLQISRTSGHLGAILDALQTLDAHGVARVAVGCPAHGVHGFRLSLEQALATRRLGEMGIGSADGRTVLLYENTDVAALFVVEPLLAREFIERHLGPLAGDEPRLAELRQTLAAYLEENRSPSAAARRLHTHRNTVVYRLNQAQELFGEESSEWSLQVRIALHLAEVLGTAVLTPKPPG